MRKLLLATSSSGKLSEIYEIIGDLPLELMMLSQVKLPDNFKVVENGKTFAENAVIKAKAYGKASSLLTLADDSGLCVEALSGRPGIYTARYTKGSDEKRYRKLLGEMKNLPSEKRDAFFVCAAALYNPATQETIVKTGVCKGKIAFNPKGSYGFGYDPVFIVDKLNKHFAELANREKNKISHRAQAMEKLRKYLENCQDCQSPALTYS